ncbi:hypothetical protein Mmc1_2219 [Magnetococcus marinus MC-1]|uniref:Uncharacterized protein n=1 Tax=Magnetococcus marinus (strain ATCC BAA-1437 / JCM 17883 / MC-1) TaxID=156889 RepID=A0L9S7_MAGMM|nr:hypothetical protein [Magnetococcus marinus]ABK44720.1 hypothetical protein Mmc1_2219 [Magnetococcus marinus MC-1]
MAKWYVWMVMATLPLSGCLEDPAPREVYKSLEQARQDRLPVAPHVTQVQARPSKEMVHSSRGVPVRFQVLDKRTLKIHAFVVSVGEPTAAPWNGGVLVHAFVPDLLIYQSQAIHGPDGHINPAVWLELRGRDHQLLYEGWLFVRDGSQVAWDHPRFDLTFKGAQRKNG